MTQQNKLIKRLRKGWLNSLDAMRENMDLFAA